MMKGEWCYFKSYFSKQDCEEIIHLAKQLPSGRAGMGLGEDTYENDSYRRSNITFINDGDWRFKKLFDGLWETQRAANKDFFNFHVTKLDYIQFAEYNSSELGEYKEHHDVFWLNDDPEYHRKLSCVIQLSDPDTYEGGNLQITEGSTAPDPNEYRAQGSVIYFPSMFRHVAHPVTAGVRYSIAAWFEGPKWR